MMSEKRIYKDFDLPTNHLPGKRHYVPRPARSATEIARRRGLRRGTLLAEHQVRGLTVAAAILEKVEEPVDVQFSAKVLAVSGINSAWYSFARGAEEKVMRRRLKLPLLATGDAERRPDVTTLLPSARQRVNDAALQAHLLVGANELLSVAKIEDHKKQLGRAVGGASLELACIASQSGFSGFGKTVTDFDAQNFARQRGLWALHHGRTLATEMGSYPSIAQLADVDSDLSVYWRRQAPNGALEAYEQALSDPTVA
jgi:hypothetical protein